MAAEGARSVQEPGPFEAKVQKHTRQGDAQGGQGQVDASSEGAVRGPRSKVRGFQFIEL